ELAHDHLVQVVGDHHLLFGLEVPEERGVRDLGGPGDLVDGGAVVALLGEQPHRRGPETGPGALLAQLPQARLRCVAGGHPTAPTVTGAPTSPAPPAGASGAMPRSWMAAPSTSRLSTILSSHLGRPQALSPSSESTAGTTIIRMMKASKATAIASAKPIIFAVVSGESRK